MKIYLVMGMTGEYEDRHTWPVAGYANKEEAEHHAKRAGERAKEIIAQAMVGSDIENFHYPIWHDVMEKEKNTFDKHFHCDLCSRKVDYFVGREPIDVFI